GAGIAGLAFAVALNAFDSEKKFAIDLYEAVSELSEIGAGINVWPRTWQILEEIGLGQTLIPHLDHYPDLEHRVVFEIRKADQENGVKITDVMKDGGVLRIHRADFQTSLIKHLPLPASSVKINSTCNLHLSHRLVDYGSNSTCTSEAQQRGSLLLYFSDKPTSACDILVGADGIKSTLRQLFLARLPGPDKYQIFHDPVWSGSIAYRGIVDKNDLQKIFPNHRALNHAGLMYFGKRKHTVVYPISSGRFLNVVAVVHDKSKEGMTWEGPWNQEVTQDEFFGKFSGWEEEFQALIRCIRRPTRWALQSLNHLDIFAKDRVFLIGDSAHAMVPYQGAGAAAGIEDAYILAALLTQCSQLSMCRMSRLAQVYNSMRVPAAIALSKASADQGDLYNLEGPGFECFKEGDYIPREQLVELFRIVEQKWSWTASDPQLDRIRATELLQDSKSQARL
ncbi:Salicylate hydroxylase, partial [Leucoagaricus sp. SymC.cos]